MSRVGKLPVQVADDIKVEVSGFLVKVQGPKGSLEKEFSGFIAIEYKDSQITVKPLNDSAEAKAMWGTARSIINGMVIGVKGGFSQELEVNGVGYRVSVKGTVLRRKDNMSKEKKVIRTQSYYAQYKT